MPAYQVVEKESFGTDWAAVRYYDRALTRFESEEAATKEAIHYLTERNCNNALTADEKKANVEVFMMTKEGCLLGELDGKMWYFTYPKDIVDSQGKVIHARGSNVVDPNWFELDGKSQVAVRPLPGT